MAIKLKTDKEKFFYGVHIMYMGDTGKYEFRRNFEKDVIAEVLPDSPETAEELIQVANEIEKTRHLAIDNLNQILEEMPHEKKGELSKRKHQLFKGN